MCDHNLLPCPFCGYKAVVEEMQVRKGYEAVAQCLGCGAFTRTVTYDTQEEATSECIKDWNMRHGVKFVKECIQKLENAPPDSFFGMMNKTATLALLDTILAVLEGKDINKKQE